MPKLCSFVISEPIHLSLISNYNTVVQSSANLRYVVVSQAFKDSRPYNFIRHSSIRKAQTAKSHPAKAVKRTIINQNKCFPLACTYLCEIHSLNQCTTLREKRNDSTIGILTSDVINIKASRYTGNLSLIC